MTLLLNQPRIVYKRIAFVTKLLRWNGDGDAGMPKLSGASRDTSKNDMATFLRLTTRELLSGESAFVRFVKCKCRNIYIYSLFHTFNVHLLRRHYYLLYLCRKLIINDIGMSFRMCSMLRKTYLYGVSQNAMIKTLEIKV